MSDETSDSGEWTLEPLSSKKTSKQNTKIISECLYHNDRRVLPDRRKNLDRRESIRFELDRRSGLERRTHDYDWSSTI